MQFVDGMETANALRVSTSTPDSWNERIRKKTLTSIEQTIAGGRDAIDARLRALDREWDIERVTSLSAAIDAALTLAVGARRGHGWWKWGLAFLAGALATHVAVGQCPSLPLYRRLGFRTPREIEEERFALKLARGDFGAQWAASAETMLAQVQR
jgi:hypothetical protein